MCSTNKRSSVTNHSLCVHFSADGGRRKTAHAEPAARLYTGHRFCRRVALCLSAFTRVCRPPEKADDDAAGLRACSSGRQQSGRHRAAMLQWADAGRADAHIWTCCASAKLGAGVPRYKCCVNERQGACRVLLLALGCVPVFLWRKTVRIILPLNSELTCGLAGRLSAK